MRPEDAQEQTERKWAYLTAIKHIRDIRVSSACGWCDFASELTPRKDKSSCHNCPIVAITGDNCTNTKEYNTWACVNTVEALIESAQKVYDLLVANRDQLIEAGKEILRGQSE